MSIICPNLLTGPPSVTYEFSRTLNRLCILCSTDSIVLLTSFALMIKRGRAKRPCLWCQRALFHQHFFNALLAPWETVRLYRFNWLSWLSPSTWKSSLDSLGKVPRHRIQVWPTHLGKSLLVSYILYMCLSLSRLHSGPYTWDPKVLQSTPWPLPCIHLAPLSVLSNAPRRFSESSLRLAAGSNYLRIELPLEQATFYWDTGLRIFRRNCFWPKSE